MYPDFLTATVIICTGALYLALKRCRSTRGVSPPGPPAIPIIGNLFTFPAGGAWHLFLEWKEKYGNLVFLHGLGNSILVVNSFKEVNDLFEKRGANYSHRPVLTAVGELMGVDQSVGLLPYGEEWRKYRKLTHPVLSAPAVRQWHSAQEDMSALLVHDIIERPEQFMGHIRLATVRISLRVGYGLFVETAAHPLVQDNEELMEIISQGMSPGAFLCDMLPILKYSPSWVPFQRRIAKGRDIINRGVRAPFEEVRRLVHANKASPSISRDLIMSGDWGDPKMFQRASWAVADVYGAGTETSYGTTLTVILALALNQTAQKRAQEELDSVVGVERMPTITDAPNLPYLVSCIKEAMRWRPPVPLSLPRRTAQDDVYNGYFIPKDTMVLPNVWAISRDVPNPEQFNPDRFMSKDARPVDPHDYVFGFGRRVCVGRYLAENTVLAMVSSILWACDIKPAEGVDLMNHPYVQQLISYPEPFKCAITPRSASRIEVVQHKSTEAAVRQS